MIKILALLFYIYSGEVTVEQIPSKNVDDCKAKVATRISELNKDPRFDAGLFAGCVAIKVTEANADKR